MLNPEQAKQQLEALKVQDWKLQKVTIIANLPEVLRAIAWGILSYDANGQAVEWRESYKIQDKAIKEFDDLDPSQRLQIFEVFFPHFPQQVERAWQLIKRLPYQGSYLRKAFHAPNHPEITYYLRSQWLKNLLQVVEGYARDLPWFAAWAPYLGYYAGDALGILFAATIQALSEQSKRFLESEDSDSSSLLPSASCLLPSQQGKEIFEILIASARGEHEIGAMGRHITRALLVSYHPDGWEFIEKLLLAAQRQEGLRQTILETVDEAHPEAFRRMIRLILDNDLTRFSATIRAVDVWFGFGWESPNARIVKGVLEQVWQFLENPEARQEALQSDDAQTVYLALWTFAFEDAIATIPIASEFFHHGNVEHRFVAVHLLTQLQLTEAKIALIPALEDKDLRVATHVLKGVQSRNDPKLAATDLFERLEKILPQFPEKPKILSSLVWEWMSQETSRQDVAEALLYNLGDRSPKRLIPYLSLLEPYKRADVAKKLAAVQPWDAEIRDTLFSLVGDASSWVRERIIEILSTCIITSEEATILERLLTRKAGDLRRGILGLLFSQRDENALNSAERLMSAKKAPQRAAGLELLREMVSKKRCVNECRTRAEQYQSRQSQPTQAETQLLDLILETKGKEPTLEDALGLLDPQQLTPIVSPEVKQPRIFVSEAAKACLQSLDDLIHENRQTPFQIETWQGMQEQLLGNTDWRFPSPDFRKTVEEDIERLPLREVWEKWWRERADELKDEDGLELLRAIASLNSHRSHSNEALKQLSWWVNLRQTLFVDVEQLRYPILVRKIFDWIIRLHPLEKIVDFLLDCAATTINLLPQDSATVTTHFHNYGWDLRDSIFGWLELIRYHRACYSSSWNDEHQIQYWHLLRCLARLGIATRHYSPCELNLEDVLIAYRAGGATEADIIAHLLAAPNSKPNSRSFYEFRNITGRKLSSHLAQYSILKEICDRARQRILEIELNRGDLPSAASHPALALRSLEGIQWIVRLLQVIGKDKLIRTYAYDNLSKASVFSHLIRVSFPSEFDTPQEFAKQVKVAKISQARLLELAFYAPQWSNYVETALGWLNLAETVWWIHAHTKDNNWHVDSDIRETWTAQVSERTPLSAQNLIDGAVDVDWFNRIYNAIEAERWQQIDEAAKYASGGGGHKRAQLFADAMLGRIERGNLVNQITQKRHQDSIRALGLLPLEKGKKRDKDLLERYQIIQEFRRGSRKFGSQRQASEQLAATIAMENLARTAGYPDPQRLEWAMEAQAVADLAESPVTVIIDNVSVSLAITDQGEPQITVLKQGKPLKSIPAKIGKDPQISELKTRKQQIAQQASRMRISLEQAMCRGDVFTAAELHQLCLHPVLAPMLAELIFIEEGGQIGYPVEKGKALQFHDGTITPIESGNLRIAHPHDLLATREWHLWQQECFDKERNQPFKQVFRELYILTQTEQADQKISRRYAGHQINPRQALALFGQRGWVTCPEEGVRRTFHDAGISAWVTFLQGFYTPTEVEGLTIEGVHFSKRGEWKPLELEEIPPRLFSEVMRDLDLVVSVAHQGGVDPEASASTVEMRSSLIRETCRLLKLSNVKLQSSHAIIEGHLGSYSVHLGSAVVHRQPGGSLCIVPVHSQHRGRLFLPFADDDPKTAEVISKILLLAKDREIQDPTILSQILA